MTDFTEGDRNIPDQELYEFVETDKNLNSWCMYKDVSIKYLILNHVYSFKVRLLFDDGG